MALKDFDFKELMLKHGQFVALGIGLVVLIPLTILGPGESVRQWAGVDQRQSASRSHSDKRMKRFSRANRLQRRPKSPSNSCWRLRTRPLIRSLYDTVNPWVVPSTFEDSKRRNPEVLLAGELTPGY